MNLLYIKDRPMGEIVVIPSKLDTRGLETYVYHLGVVKMKALATDFIWWPCIEQQTEQLVKECMEC